MSHIHGFKIPLQMGIIKDEGVVELNWNKKKTDVLGFFLRQYLKISICQINKKNKSYLN